MSTACKGTMVANMEDRVLLVTGANSGIGKATALGLARLGGTVVMACRSATRGAAARARIVNVSSSAHSGGTIHFDDLQGERRYGGFGAYGQSKLAQILFTQELARRLQGTGVTVNACHPGVIRTNLGMGGTSVVVQFVRMFLKSPEKGAETPIYLSISPDVAGVTGKYFANKHIREPSRAAQDPVAARRLFDVSK